ncbi:MAG TPA: hypothetical protein VK809_09360 [Bacteroidia bacterium]|jgi:hypothetical protein|nr:hypothetical protein [Bacteroidia bacterium]
MTRFLAEWGEVAAGEARRNFPKATVPVIPNEAKRNEESLTVLILSILNLKQSASSAFHHFQ